MRQPTGFADRWRASPWSLKAYTGVVVTNHLFSLAVGNIDGDQIGRQVEVGRFTFWAVLASMVVFFLFLGSRAAWIASLVWDSFGLFTAAGTLIARPKPPGTSVWVEIAYVVLYVGLVLLLAHPLTQAWCKRKLRLTEPEKVSLLGERPPQ